MKAYDNNKLNYRLSSNTSYNNSNVPDPIAGRSGSFFFGPNQEIAYRNNAPQGRVFGGISSSDRYSFGRSKIRDKHYNIHIFFGTPNGTTDKNTGYKNHELVNDIFEKIEQTVMNNCGLFGHVVLEKSNMEDDIQLFEDANVYGAQWLFVFKDRK